MATPLDPPSTASADVQAGKSWGGRRGVPQPAAGHGTIPAPGTCSARVELPVGASRARVAEDTLLVPWKGAARSSLLHAVDSRTPDSPQENGWPLS